MGATHSGDYSIPPGGALLYVQRQECGAQPGFLEPKPACLSTIPDSIWQTFQSKVAMAASAMWSEKAMLIGFLAFPLVIVGVLLRSFLGEQYFFFTIIFAIVSVAATLGTRFFLITQNEKQDNVIRRACSEFANSTGLNVVYRTLWTGFCRPKGAVPFRAIAITPTVAPMGVASANQLINVQVPPGAGPGTTLQVQSPSGQQIQVVVPDGVSEGQVFQVQEPPLVVEATVVGNE